MRLNEGLPLAVFVVVLVVAHAFGTLLTRPTRAGVRPHLTGATSRPPTESRSP